jgi:tetratricopeptide (TPR) repeat protein
MDMYSTPQTLFRTAGAVFGAAFIGAALLVQPAPVEAAGSDTPSCPTGQVWSKKRGKCIPANMEQMNNEQRYEHGWKLAKSGRYEEAIQVLKTADQNDPRVLNYLGYSYRKSGDLKTAIGFYKTALRINPDFVLAREYLGEGYVKAGRLDLAKLELDQIDKRCGKGCKEYVELAAVIDKGVDSAW